MTKLEQWLNSGLYVFVVLSEQGYQDNSLAVESWPDAAIYGNYRLVNFHKDSYQYFIDHLDSIGLIPSYGISESTPMLLTWGEAIEFTNKCNTVDDNV